MYIPRYWKRVEKEVVVDHVHDDRWSLGGENVPVHIHAWGYSDNSESEALKRANQRITEIAKVLSARFNENEYYPLRVMHEEILKRIGTDDSSLVTRNRYGAQVLNSPEMMFIDIDVVTDDIRPAGLFQRLFGKTKEIEAQNILEKQSRYDTALKKVDDYIRQDSQCGFLVYRTFAGLRLIATHKTFDPKSEEAEKIFDALGSDPLYQKLCKAQACFRARLTPKFWRMQTDFRYPSPSLKVRITKNMLPEWDKFDEERLEEYDAWVDKYEDIHEKHATCKYLKHMGNKEILESFKSLISYHDAVTQARKDLPLA